MHVADSPAVTNRLRGFRQSRGLALYGLGALARVSPTTICAIEKWNYLPRQSVRDRLARALGGRVVDIWPEGETGDDAV